MFYENSATWIECHRKRRKVNVEKSNRKSNVMREAIIQQNIYLFALET